MPTTLDTPVGTLLLAADAHHLTHVVFADEPHAGKARTAAADDENPAVLAEAARQLRAYFDGTLRTFDLPLAARGTPFQRDVWRTLRTVPFGETTHYGALAARLGRASAVRAVGAANGANPISIVVPCHRVVGRDGSLTGYAGGLARKRWLLDHEARHARL